MMARATVKNNISYQILKLNNYIKLIKYKFKQKFIR